MAGYFISLLGKEHQTALPKVAVDATLASIIACRNGDHAFITGIAVIIYALIAVAGSEQDNASLPVADLGGGIINREPGRSRKRHVSVMEGIVGIYHSPSSGPQLHEITSAPFLAAQ